MSKSLHKRNETVLSHQNWKREKLFDQNYRCHYCKVELNDGAPEHIATLDHVVPRARGGQDTKENTVVACDQCNRRKGSLDVGEFLCLLRSTVRVFVNETV